MELSRLRDRLDRIAWREQAADELAERAPTAPGAMQLSVDSELRELARALDTQDLDRLEGEDGYTAWALRLAPYVDPAGAAKRAARYIDSDDRDIRHWARVIARGNTTDHPESHRRRH